MARANSRGNVRRKPLAKLRANEQEPHMRRNVKPDSLISNNLHDPNHFVISEVFSRRSISVLKTI